MGIEVYDKIDWWLLMRGRRVREKITIKLLIELK
jgi:hypothetical protein